MARLSVLNHVSLDGYFVDADGDMSWARTNDAEWNIFVEQNTGGIGTLVFGRITFELMAGFWPTPFAAESFPAVAERMNTLPKFVVVKPIVLGKGRTIFEGVREKLHLKPIRSRVFANGNILQCYEPVS